MAMMQQKKSFQRNTGGTGHCSVQPCVSIFWFSSQFLKSLSLPCLGDVDTVKVVGSEGTVAFWALPLPRVVAHLETFVAEDVETFREHGLLVSHVAAGAS